VNHPVDEFTLTSKRTPAARGRLRREVLFAGIVLAIAFGLAQFYYPSWLEQPLPILEGPRGFSVYADPLKGWTLAFPDAWHAETSTIRGRHGGFAESSGITISNIEHPSPDFPTETPIDSRLVAVSVRYMASRSFVIWCRTDTKLPLNLKGSNQRRRQPILDDSGGEVTNLHRGFSKAGDPLYSVHVWIGSRASREDIDLMEAIVGSINYTPSGDLRYGQVDCSDGVKGW
jgi:hypothetical protein